MIGIRDRYWELVLLGLLDSVDQGAGPSFRLSLRESWGPPRLGAPASILHQCEPTTTINYKGEASVSMLLAQVPDIADRYGLYWYLHFVQSADDILHVVKLLVYNKLHYSM